MHPESESKTATDFIQNNLSLLVYALYLELEIQFLLHRDLRMLVMPCFSLSKR